MSFRVSSVNSYNYRLLHNKKDENGMLKITDWCGRLGNNIIQVINALHIAIGKNTNLLIPNHSYFNKTQFIVNSDIKYLSNFLYDISFNFFFRTFQYQKYFEDNHVKVREKLKEAFIINTDELEYDENENNLVIHIRGGDIICGKGHPEFPILPISYYEKIINSKIWENITIISEDKNWIVDILLKKYPHIHFKIQSLQEDIITILKSKNIVISSGTFVPALIILSNNKKNVYKTTGLNLEFLDLYHPHNYIYYDLQDYFKETGKWCNSPNQIELVKKYQFKNYS